MMTEGIHSRLKQWRHSYVEANRATLNWMLARPVLQGVFLNTKMNHLTGHDFTKADGWRGPDVILGWIQGRGLEALVVHAGFFEAEDKDLSARLDQAGRTLYEALHDMFRANAKGYFAYDSKRQPVFPDQNGVLHPQSGAHEFSTFSDVFIVKGLIAAACRYEPKQLPRLLTAWHKIIEDIEANRFIINERQNLDLSALKQQQPDYGPRMIMLGGAALLRSLGMEEEARFGERFLQHILTHHLTRAPLISAPVLTDCPGGTICNPGHALEFSGFGLEYFNAQQSSELTQLLLDLIKNHIKIGFQFPGIVLKRDIVSGEILSPYFPWWPLPEAIRAASLGFERSSDIELLVIWEKTHEAFFENFWRKDLSIATQTRTIDGPIDFVPSTSDLDPGYHTGLSFYCAIKAIDNLSQC
jgi:hypothetical protein